MPEQASSVIYPCAQTPFQEQDDQADQPSLAELPALPPKLHQQQAHVQGLQFSSYPDTDRPLLRQKDMKMHYELLSTEAQRSRYFLVH